MAGRRAALGNTTQLCAMLEPHLLTRRYTAEHQIRNTDYQIAPQPPGQTLPPQAQRCLEAQEFKRRKNGNFMGPRGGFACQDALSVPATLTVDP